MTHASIKSAIIASAALSFVASSTWAPAAAGPEFNLEDRIVEIELNRSGELRAIRFEDEKEFTPVVEGFTPALVRDLATYVRHILLDVYFAEQDGTLFAGYHHPTVCRFIFKDMADIVGPVFVDLPLAADGDMVIKFPDGQTVTISGSSGEVDFGGGPELLTFYLPEEPITGIDIVGYSGFKIFEFFQPDTQLVVSRNAVTSAPFE